MRPPSTCATRSILICALLVAATWAIYGQVRRFPLVDFDDLSYVTDNPHVSGGLSTENVAWAFTHSHDGYWSPLTWVSYQADTSLFGGRSGAYHLTNVAIHAASACLLFAVLFRMTKREWPSGIVAALFAIHPLHVESVAWVAERKDVLSGFFWFLTIWTYVRYVDRPSWKRYAWVVAAFACGLMAKPIVVTLPIVLLLLDVWPLERAAAPPPARERNSKLRKRSPRSQAAAARVDDAMRLPAWSLVREKVPLLILALATGLVTVITQRGAGAIAAFQSAPIDTRIANALVSPVFYLVKMVWPTGLAAIYPYPGVAPVGQAAAAAVILAAISMYVVRERRHAPYLAIGWLWYLVTLLPVLGLIQAGPQARADRYTYLSMVGIWIMIAWSGARVVSRRAAIARIIAIPVCLVLALEAVLAWRQVQYWRDGETVFRRALAVTSGNYVAYLGLAAVLRSQERFDEAIAAYEESIRLSPRFAEAYAGLGEALLATGRTDAAAIALAEAVRLAPADAISLSNLGSTLARMGRLDEAAVAYRESIRLAPGRAEAHLGLALVFDGQDRLDEALREFAEATRINPAFENAHFNMGIVLARRGRVAEALPHFREAARLNPGSVEPHVQLGNALAMAGQMDEAIAELTVASRLKPSDADVHSNLGLALASRGRFEEAIVHLEQAIRQDPNRQELRGNLAFVQARRKEAGRR